MGVNLNKLQHWKICRQAAQQDYLGEYLWGILMMVSWAIFGAGSG